MIVASFMTPDPITVSVGDELDTALRLMDEHDVRHLPVLDGEALVGVISDRDLLLLTGGVRGTGQRVPGGAKVGDHLEGTLITAEPEDSAVAILVDVVLRGIGCLPVVKQGALVGIVTEMDLMREFVRVSNAGELAGEVDPAVDSLMTRKVHTIDRGASLMEALGLTRAKQIRHLPVVHDGRLVGILSDRDLRRAYAHGHSAEVSVEETMTHAPRSAAPDETVSAAARIMTEHKVSALPVLRGEELVGILTIPDVLDHCMGTLRLA